MIMSLQALFVGSVVEMKLLTKNEIEKILETVSVRRARTFLVFNTLAKTGCRVSELIAITPNDIITQFRQIVIHGKGGKIRNVDVPPDCILPLNIYIKQKRIKVNERIFPVTRHAINQLTKRYANTNPHTFRHSYAVELLQKTKNIRYVQLQLGHTSLSTTQIYLRYMDYKEDKKKLAGLWK